MLRRIKRLISAMLTVMLAAALCFSVSAVTVNGHDANEGSVIDYAIHAVACPSGIQAIDLSVFYDSDSLEYILDSAEAPDVGDSMMNDSESGEIRYNALSVEGYDFTDDTVLLSMKFKVKNELSSDVNIYYTVKNFIDNNGSDLKDIYTYDITYVNDEHSSDLISENTSSTVETVSSSVSSNDESRNDASSKEAPNSSIESSAVEVPSANSESDVAGTDEASAYSDPVSRATQDIPLDRAIKFDSPDTPDSEASGKNNKYKTGIWFCIAGIVILSVIVLIILFKDNKKGKHYA